MLDQFHEQSSTDQKSGNLSPSSQESREYNANPGEPLMLGDLAIYPDTYEAYRADEKISLRRKEYQLLEFLIRNKNKVLNRHTILEYLWNYNSQSITNTLDVHMSSLRKKIDGNHRKKMIHTIYGAGYKLCEGD